MLTVYNSVLAQNARHFCTGEAPDLISHSNRHLPFNLSIAPAERALLLHGGDT